MVSASRGQDARASDMAVPLHDLGARHASPRRHDGGLQHHHVRGPRLFRVEGPSLQGLDVVCSPSRLPLCAARSALGVLSTRGDAWPADSAATRTTQSINTSSHWPFTRRGVQISRRIKNHELIEGQGITVRRVSNFTRAYRRAGVAQRLVCDLWVIIWRCIAMK